MLGWGPQRRSLVSLRIGQVVLIVETCEADERSSYEIAALDGHSQVHKIVD